MSRRDCPPIDWFNVTVWTLIMLYCLTVMGLAALGAAYLAGWLP